MTSADRRASILVVDDVFHTVEVLQRNLTAAGYIVFTASGGSGAIEILNASPVDLVVTDLRMPRVIGIDLVRHVRANHRDTEVVMVTDHPTIEGAVEAAKTGAEEYLAKTLADVELLPAFHERQPACWVGHGIDPSCEAGPLGDILVGHQMHIEQAARPVPRPQVIHFIEAEAPAFKPQQEVVALPRVSTKVDEEVDVTAEAGGRVLCAAEDVERDHPESLGIELGGDVLGDAEPPDPEPVGDAGRDAASGLGKLLDGRLLGQHGDGLCQVSVHQKL